MITNTIRSRPLRGDGIHHTHTAASGRPERPSSFVCGRALGGRPGQLREGADGKGKRAFGGLTAREISAEFGHLRAKDVKDIWVKTKLLYRPTRGPKERRIRTINMSWNERTNGTALGTACRAYSLPVYPPSVRLVWPDVVSDRPRLGRRHRVWKGLRGHAVR